MATGSTIKASVLMPMMIRLFLGFLSIVGLAATNTFAQTVRFDTVLGNIDVVLRPDVAPLTVANFLNYVNRGAYNNTFFHRSVRDFVVQGGGFTFQDNRARVVAADPAVKNEYRISNTRGTIAMAKLEGNPDSATNQWFFSLGDNSGNLDAQNGGFTVFGQIANDEGLAVMDAIAAVPRYTGRITVNDLPIDFAGLPLRSISGSTINASNLVMVRSIAVLNSMPAITENGIVSASQFGGATTAAAGSYIEIYGSGLSSASRIWGEGDFVNGRAPTSLEGVSVTIDGKDAFVYFVSPAQLNVQVPEGVASGTNVPVVVSYGGQSSAARSVTIAGSAGGLLAPGGFKIGDRQYVAAVHGTSGAFVSGGNIPDVGTAPAVPGETLVFYGTGFGAVTPGSVAGQVAQGSTMLTAPIEFRFGETTALVQYAGLAPGQVGLYQFNVVVPAGVADGDVSLRVSVGGSPIAQTLFLAVRR